MPINTVHPQFSANIDKWTRCRDAFDGGDAIRAKGQQYLPKIDPNQSSNEYESYSKRPTYFEVVGRTVEGFIGAISRKPHVIDIPTGIKAMMLDATAHGVSLQELIKCLAKEVLLQGRCGLLVDYDEKLQRPFLVLYQVESITNWNEDRVILRDTAYEPDPTDIYTLKAIEQYRELFLDDGVYTAPCVKEVAAWIGSEPQGALEDRHGSIWTAV
jgi:hypothetical protein